jgi:CDP-paratose 2-epimerase
MSVAVITGSSGLIGSETAQFFHEKGLEIIGIDNNMRRYFFGEEGCTEWVTRKLKRELRCFTHLSIDIRDQESIFRIFRKFRKNISVVVHTAAQPSHDWAAREPFTDFTINANGSLVLLEATRAYCPDAAFMFTSTNKVYGDKPNQLPVIEKETRWEVNPSHSYAKYGIDEELGLDQSKHSLFGVSKVSADILTQEYGHYFGLKTAVFRAGCLTGPAHSGTELHGFLAHLAKCVVTGKPYTIYGYKGKQVRDNIHSYDLVTAFWEFFLKPKRLAVYNIGGSRHSNCSVLEAIRALEELSGRKLDLSLSEQPRSGDHIWWISDVRRFQQDYPEWRYHYDLATMLKEIVDALEERVRR